MTEKTLEYYIALPYRIEIYPEEDGSGYTAAIPDLPGCVTSAPTIEALGDMIAEAKSLWLEVALEDGDYIPEPAPAEMEEYSGRFVARLPRSLHRQLAQRATRENTSLNQLVVALLAEGMGRWSEQKPSARAVRYESTHATKPFLPTGFQSFKASLKDSFTAPKQRPVAIWNTEAVILSVQKGAQHRHD